MSLHAEAIRWAYKLGYRALPDGSIVNGKGTPVRLRLPPYAETDAKRRYYRFNVVPSAPSGSRFILAHKFCAFCWFGEVALQPGTHVRHLNSDSLDNSTENLGLGSHTDNMRDKSPAVARRAAFVAAKARRSLTDDEVRRIVALKSDGWTGKSLAAEFKTRESTISEILSGKLYSAVTGIAQKPRHRNDVPTHLRPAQGAA